MSVLLSVLPLLLPSVDAQGIPSGGSIVSVFGHPAGAEGLWLVQANGAEQQITGLATAGSAGTSVNSVQLDPVDDRIWIGGINDNGNTSGQVNWIRVSATNTVAQFRQHAQTGTGQSVAGITFDDNGNPIVVSGRNNVGGGVFRIDRATGASTRIASLPNGLHNAITRDPTGNLYLGIFDTVLGAGGGEVYRMQKNPDCTFQAPVLLGTLPDPRTTAVEWARDPLNGGNDVLVLTTFGPMFELSAMGGTPTLLTRIGQLNWVELDNRLDRFLLIDDGSYGSEVFTLTRDYATAALHARLLNAGAGVTSCIDINDDEFGDIRVIPACPVRDVPVDIEMGVSCPPGQIAVLHIVAPVAVPIVVAMAPSLGRVFTKIPGLIVPAALPPGALVLQAACFDPVSATLTVGRPLSWPAN